MDTAELERQVEYKFAPGPLLAVQAFANTYDFEEDEELLGDPAAARDWLLRSDLAIPETEVGDAELEELRDFRAAVRAQLEANLSGEDGDPAALARFAENRGVKLAPAADGSLGVDVEPVASVDELIAQLLGIVHRAQLLGEWSRLKICAADDCRWAFYDSSKNRRGHWCTMEGCGNRAKNRAFRDRRAGAKRSS